MHLSSAVSPIRCPGLFPLEQHFSKKNTRHSLLPSFEPPSRARLLSHIGPPGTFDPLKIHLSIAESFYRDRQRVTRRPENVFFRLDHYFDPLPFMFLGIYKTPYDLSLDFLPIEYTNYEVSSLSFINVQRLLFRR